MNAAECPACGNPESTLLLRGTDRLYHTTDRDFEVVECRGCRLIRLSPQPQPAELSHYYPRNYWFAPGASKAGRMEERYRRFVLLDHARFILQAAHECGAATLLDVGCGGGLLASMLRRRGLRTYGLDYSIEAASIASHVNGVPAVCGSLARCPFPPASFDIVTMFHVLEHLYDPRAYIETAGELLRPGGRLIVQVPNAASWQFLLLGEAWNGVDIPRHLHNFRDTDLALLLDSAGFEVVRRKYFSLRDNPAGLATSLAPSLDPMARRMHSQPEGGAARLAKDLLYFGLVLIALPLTAVEAACGAGSTIMMEARRRA